MIRWGNDPPQRDPRSYDQCEVLFGSAHSTGAHFAVADGAVRFVSYGTERTVFQRACQRDDGEASGVP